MKSALHPSEQLPIRFAKILFTTDFSPWSAMALPYAAAIARRFRSTLYVAHVITSESYAHIPLEQRATELARMRQEAEGRILTLLAGSHFNGIPHQLLLDHGEILPVLSSIVEKHNVDLVVTGMHGRHGLQKLWSGSTAEEIVRLETLPVLLVGPAVTIDPQAEVHLRRILHVTDFSAESRRALDYAWALAKAYRADLYLLHIVDNVWKEPLSTRMPPDSFFRLRLLEEQWPVSQQGVEPKFLVEFGPPETLILEAAKQHDIQLIVLSVPGTSHPALTAHLPGPLAYNVVSHSSCPVLGVRAIAEQENAVPKTAA